MQGLSPPVLPSFVGGSHVPPSTLPAWQGQGPAPGSTVTPRPGVGGTLAAGTPSRQAVTRATSASVAPAASPTRLRFASSSTPQPTTGPSNHEDLSWQAVARAASAAVAPAPSPARLKFASNSLPRPTTGPGNHKGFSQPGRTTQPPALRTAAPPPRAAFTSPLLAREASCNSLSGDDAARSVSLGSRQCSVPSLGLSTSSSVRSLRLRPPPRVPDRSPGPEPGPLLALARSAAARMPAPASSVVRSGFSGTSRSREVSTDLLPAATSTARPLMPPTTGTAGKVHDTAESSAQAIHPAQASSKADTMSRPCALHEALPLPAGKAPLEPVAKAALAAELLRVPRPLVESRVMKKDAGVSEKHKVDQHEVARASPALAGTSSACGVDHRSHREISWIFDASKHPLVREGEIACINDVLERLVGIVACGGLTAFTAPGSTAACKVLGRSPRSDITEEDLVRLCFESILKGTMRTGGDDLFVESGSVMSFGEKKVVKLTLTLRDEIHFRVSVCWRWDTELQSAS